MLSRRVLLTSALLGTAYLLTWSACGPVSRGSRVQAQIDRKTAPDFTLKDVDGRAVKLSDYRGKVVLLDFWATWCGPCKVEIPWFTEFERTHKANGFAVLGVAMDEGGWDDVRPFLKEIGVNYRVVLGNDATADSYGGIEALPTTFLIDRQGMIASRHIGLSAKKDFEDEIRHLLSTDSQRTARSLPFSTPFAGLLRTRPAAYGW